MNFGIEAAGARTAENSAGGGPEKLRRACQEFESILVSRLFASMRATVPKNPLFHGGSAEDLFTSMHDEQMARQLSAQRGFGLARLLFERLSGQGAGENETEHHHGRRTAAKGSADGN